MGRVTKFDQKAVKNRARVKRYRYFKKAKAIHEKYIHDQMFVEENDQYDTTLNGFSINDLYHENPIRDEATEISDKLKYWCVDHRITAIAMNDLLSILRFAGLGFLPKDCRTLMGTPVSVPIHTLSNGKMWYNGVQKSLECTLDKISNDTSITLDWNFDGLPISKSSNNQFWPILLSIRGKYFCKCCFIFSTIKTHRSFEILCRATEYFSNGCRHLEWRVKAHIG